MIELLKRRRSIRKFRSEKIEEEKLKALKKALLLAPTSRNIDSVEFVFVDCKDDLEYLSISKPNGAAFLKDAALGIVVVGNEDKSDVWVEDASIASIVVQLEAEAIGLGSCWIQIRNRYCDGVKTAEDYIRDKLGIAGNYRVESIIAVGYRDEKKDPVSENELDFSKIHINRFIKK